MELVGIATSLILLHSLGKCGSAYTDNQGIVKQLNDPRRMRRSGLMGGSPLSLRAREILQEGHISLHWHRVHPDTPLAQGSPGTPREKPRSLGSRRLGHLFGQSLPPPSRASPSPSVCPTIPMLQTILTDITVIKQQLGPCTRCSFRDHHEILLGTIPARQLLAPLQRRGTLLRTIWDQWWHRENRWFC